MSAPESPFSSHPVSRDPLEQRRAMQEHLRGVPFTWASEWPTGPITLNPDAAQELREVAVRIVEILGKSFSSLGTTIADRARRLGVDWDAYRAHYPFFLPDQLEERWAAAVARPDMVFSETGFKVLEANFGTALGGVMQCDVLRSFWEGAGESSSSAAEPRVMDGFAQLLLEFAREIGGAPRAAVLSLPEYQSPDTCSVYRLEAELLKARGIDAEAVSPEELAERISAPSRPPWPIGLRRNRPERWTNSRLGGEPLRRLIESGCNVVCPQSSFLMADKRLLALVSAGLVPLGDQERAFVDRYLPWTRIVQIGMVEYQGEMSTMEKLLSARQNAFVLKRGTSRGGLDVVVGREQSSSQWTLSVQAALHTGEWVVQEFQNVVPVTLPVADAQGEAGSRRFAVVLSPFVILGRSHGCVTRSLSTDATAVVSTTAGATANIAIPALR